MQIERNEKPKHRFERSLPKWSLSYLMIVQIERNGKLKRSFKHTLPGWSHPCLKYAKSAQKNQPKNFRIINILFIWNCQIKSWLIQFMRHTTSTVAWKSSEKNSDYPFRLLCMLPVTLGRALPRARMYRCRLSVREWGTIQKPLHASTLHHWIP